MSRLNTKKVPARKQRTINKAGGTAFKQSDKQALANHLLTSFCQDQYYRTQGEGLKELFTLLDKVPVDFAMKAAVFARDEFGMRTVTQVTAAYIADRLKGVPGARSFFENVVVRPDDMLEILSAYESLEPAVRSNGKIALPKAMREGFKGAFDKFDDYQIAKYKNSNKGWSLVDAVNMVRPVPTEQNAKNLAKLAAGESITADTWESAVSGSEGHDAWNRLLKEGRLGYMALVKNLRNIQDKADQETIDLACRALVNEKALRKSRIFPYRLYVAYKEIANRKLKKALNEAVDLAASNLPDLPNTLVAIDCSGSMGSFWGQSGRDTTTTPGEKAMLMGVCLAKNSDADIVLFDGSAYWKDYDLSDGTISIVDRMRFPGGATDLGCVFRSAKKAYDRVIVFSDFQSWAHSYGRSPEADYKDYCKRVGAKPKVYSIDLAGYGTGQFSGNVVELAGFNTKLFDIIGFCDKADDLVRMIESVEL